MAAAFLQGLALAQGVEDVNQQNAIVDAALAENEQPAEVCAQVVEAAQAAVEDA